MLLSLLHISFPSHFSTQAIPQRLFISSHLNMQLTYYGKRRGEETVCMHFSITNRIYSRFNVHVFVQSLFVVRAHISRRTRRLEIEWKIVSYLILSVERLMSFLYAFYSTFHLFPLLAPLNAHVILKAIDYPHLMKERNDIIEFKRNEIIFDRGLMAIVRNK